MFERGAKLGKDGETRMQGRKDYLVERIVIIII